MVHDHGAELDHSKQPGVLPYPVLPEKYGPGHGYFNKNGEDEKYRREDNEAKKGGEDVEEAFKGMHYLIVFGFDNVLGD